MGCHFLLQCRKVESENEVTQSCPTLSDPMDCSLPGSSIHGIFQARVLEWGAIAFSERRHSKGYNGRNLVDVEEIMKRWKEYMEELYKKDLNELDYDDDVVSHPEPDIWECEVKWALRSTAVNKTSGCNEIPAELFKSLKDDAIKISHSLCQQIWKPSSGHRTGKGQSSSQFPRRVVPKNVLTI